MFLPGFLPNVYEFYDTRNRVGRLTITRRRKFKSYEVTFILSTLLFYRVICIRQLFIKQKYHYQYCLFPCLCLQGEKQKRYILNFALLVQTFKIK